jgi:tripartite-type tricarboxylate transporter receptor subunit TctC
VLPPGVLAERLQALQRAFDATMKDPAFLADAKRQDLEVRPVSGVEATALLQNAYATPPDLVRQAIEFMKD